MNTTKRNFILLVIGSSALLIGCPAFAEEPMFLLPRNEILNTPSDLVSGDLNGDGILELAVLSRSDAVTYFVTIYNVQQNGTFAPGPAIVVPGTIVQIEIGDINNDDILDLIVLDSASEGVRVLLGMGDGSFTTGPLSIVGNETGPFVINDFNGDGTSDIATVNSMSNDVTILSVSYTHLTLPTKA